MVLGGLLTVRALAGYFRQRFLVRVSRRLGTEVNQSFVAKLFRLTKPFFDSRKPGDILARMADTNKLQSLTLRLSTVCVVDSLVLVGSIVYLLFIDSRLGSCTIILLIFYALILNSRTHRIRDYQINLFNKFSATESAYVDSLEGINEILNFGTTKVFAKRNSDAYAAYQEKVLDLGYYQSTLTLHSELLAGYSLVGVLLWGSFLVTESRITIGQMVAIYSIFSGLMPCVMRFVETKIAFQGADLAFQRMSDLDCEVITNRRGCREFKMERSLSIVDGQIGWKQRKVLWTNVNIEIPKGFLTALAGGSGSGKSTLTEVLIRNYSLSKGSVMIDGINAEEIEPNEYRQKVSVVPQDIKIFNGTLLDNLRLGRNEIPTDEIARRVRTLGFSYFLSRFGGGLSTVLGKNGLRLSGGEIQNLGLIRALLNYPEVVIIDEALSGMDPHLKAVALKILQTYSKRNAVLVISHDQTIIDEADVVYELTETGTKRIDKYFQTKRRNDVTSEATRPWN